jgi:adenylosuccinate lyase
MFLSPLTAVSPIDGRYHDKIEKLGNYFSEFALIKYRVLIEVEYFIALCELPLPQLADIDNNVFPTLRKIYQDFSLEDAETIKNTEKITNHDVKAVEYFLKKKLEELNLSHFEEFVHFGLTSQDINNTAIPLMFKEACEEVLYPEWEKVLNALHQMSEQWRNIPMLAYTHGQPASPTRLGKEIKVFAYRLEKQFNELKNIKFPAKFGGATGNFNAHHVAYPHISWQFFAEGFVNDRLGLERSSFTTQIENYDQLAAIFDNFRRCNTIMIDFCRDVWQYISMGYFKQKIKENEVGSSAMPHKVNPIDFENAEGNLGIANAIFEHLSAKLPISRLQRDLTDSTVLRNLGVPLAHTSISLQSILKGISKLQINEAKIHQDLEENWAVVAEAIQTILRREGYPKPYEALKALTRKNEKINAQAIHQFVEELKVSDAVKKELRTITPFNYTGI